MNSHIPQIMRRKIGSVVILDLKGELVGPWALKAKDSMHTLLSLSDLPNLLINLKELETVDSLGVKAIIGNLHEDKRSGIIQGRLSVMEMFARLNVLNDIRIFHDEEEVVSFFGTDFIDNDKITFDEHRKHQRLKTAIPLEFWYFDKRQERIAFNAIVTDLSEGGLFAEYLDLETVDAFSKKLDPHELSEINIRVKLPDSDYIFAEAKVLRTVIFGEQLGVGVAFTKIDKKDQDQIRSFLA